MLVNKRNLSVESKIRTLLAISNQAILVEDSAVVGFSNNAVTVPANSPRDEFAILPKDGGGYAVPSWVKSVRDGKSNLVIFRNIDMLSKEEQERFLQILKHKSISGVDLPKDLRIILTFRKGGENLLNDKLLEYVVPIQE